MFHNKLYKKYYPISSEAEKKEFVENNSTEIMMCADRFERMCHSKIYQIGCDYRKEMKSERTFFGKLKYKNIRHNEYIQSRIENDQRIKKLAKDMYKSNSLQEKLFTGKYDEIEIDEINSFLSAVDKETRKFSISILLGAVLCVAVVICIIVF